MTPIGHLATGAAGGGLVQPLFRTVFRLPHRVIIALFLVSSVIPDVDGLPLLWSWDAYHGTYWYSHHMLGHSLLGAVAYSVFLATAYILGATFLRGVRNFFRRRKQILEFRVRRWVGAFLISYLGCLIHYAGDMIAPPGPWKGLALLWPSKEMFGGWSWIYWHNWYIIYISTYFVAAFLAVSLVAGLVQSIPHRAFLWTGRVLRVVGMVACVFYLHSYYDFVSKHNYKQVGFAAWDRLNRKLVPKEFQAFADRHAGSASVFWRKRLIRREDLLKLYHGSLDRVREWHRRAHPRLSTWLPAYRSAEEDLLLYRALQSVAPGMEDTRPGRYRVWIVRLSEPDPLYFERATVYHYVEVLREHVRQMSNAILVVFRIEERDAQGKATKVSRVFHTDKLYVPGSTPPQLNIEKVDRSIFYHQFFAKHDRIAYNAIPGLDYSRYMVLSGGFFPSYTERTGVIWPGQKTGVYMHAGVWGEGCIVASYGHTDLAEQLRFPFYRLWETASENIDISKRGVAVLPGRSRLWGRMMFLREARAVREALVRVEQAGSLSMPLEDNQSRPREGNAAALEQIRIR